MSVIDLLTQNWEGGSNARYDVSRMQRGPGNTYTYGGYNFDSEGRPLSGGVPGDGQGQWVSGKPGARGGNGPNSMGGGGGGGSPIPGAGMYGQAVNAAKARYQQRVADLNKQRSSLMRQSGFKADINEETGLVGDLKVDPYNQYGSFQLLNRAQAIRDQEGIGANIGRGLGTGGGLAAQNLNELRFGYGQEDAALGSAMTDQLGQFTRTQQDYKYEFDQALYQAQLEAARMAIEAGDYYPYGGDDDDYGDDGGDDTQTSVADRAKKALGIPARTQPKKKVVKRPKAAKVHRKGAGAPGGNRAQ